MTSLRRTIAPPGRSARWAWPIAITLVLLLSAGSNVWVMTIANRDPSFAVEPDYYRKAVAWDAQMAQARTNAALGWRAVSAIVLAKEGQPGLVRVTLLDRAGRPVSGARLSVEAMHNARASQRLESALAETSPGIYEAATAARRPGQWELRVTAVRDTTRYTETVRLTSERDGASGPGSAAP
jgi:nitrogen fixation protein FixH